MSTVTRALVALGLATRADEGTTPEAPPASYAADVTPPTRSSNATVVTPREATTLDAIYRALFILDAAAVQLTMDVTRGATRIATPSIIAKPNVHESFGGFISQTIQSLACRGNAYWRLTRAGDGSVINTTILNPLHVRAHLDRDGITRFDYEGRTYGPTDIRHLCLMRLPGEAEGLGPIQAAQRGIRGHLNVVQYGATWFTDAGVPNGTLRTDQHLTAAQAADWKAQWMGSVNGKEPAVLGAGLEYSPLYLKPSEVQWLEVQRFGVVGIARLMGMTPKQMLIALEGSSMTYSNQQQEDIAWVRHTLMRYLREIELAFSGLLPRGQEARFNLDAFLRTDTKTRYEAHAIAISAGFLTVDEVREIEGLSAAPAKVTTNA